MAICTRVSIQPPPKKNPPKNKNTKTQTLNSNIF